MKWLKAAVLCLTASMAIGATTASSASAALPEIAVAAFECEQAMTGPLNNIGQFITSAKCIDPTQANENAGLWWRFVARMDGVSTGEALIHGVVAGGLVKINIVCKHSSSEGGIPGGQSITGIVLKYTECKVEESSNACTTSGETTGTIKSKTLTGTLGYTTKPSTGIALKPVEGGTVAAFTCAGTVGAVTLEGCAIEEIAPRNTMSLTHETLFQENEAKTGQKWTKLEGGSECALTMKAQESSGKAWLKETQSQETSEEIEVKA
jgi:hypothetical protein